MNELCWVVDWSSGGRIDCADDVDAFVCGNCGVEYVYPLKPYDHYFSVMYIVPFSQKVKLVEFCSLDCVAQFERNHPLIHRA